MNRRLPPIVGLCLVLVGLALLSAAPAAAVSCTGLPAFTSCTAYANGTAVTYNGSKYTAIAAIPNTRDCPPNSPYTPATDNWWTNNGTCDAGGATATRTPTRTATATTGGATATRTPTSGGATATRTPTSSGGGGTCSPAWSASTAYSGGALVSRTCGGVNKNFQAAYWTQNNDPCTNSVPNTGDEWIDKGACSGSGGGGATPTSGARATPTVAPCTNCSSSARFVPYVDMSGPTGRNISANAAAASIPGVTLSFLVDGGCTANWAGLGGSLASGTFWDGTPVSNEVNALISSGRKVIIAWGGASGSVLSSCSSASSAHAMYQSAKTKYPGIAGQDFDIEGGVNLQVFSAALVGLSGTSVTLPVLPTGLVTAGMNVVNAVHGAGVHPIINVMAMDYGSSFDNGGNMLLSAQQAAQATRNQTGDPIGVTPMIGQNDTQGEIFTLSNASSLTTWARGQSYISRLAFWSLGRDNGGCPGQTFASPTCSGVSQSTWAFSAAMRGF
jgi:hypothetical protein